MVTKKGYTLSLHGPPLRYKSIVMSASRPYASRSRSAARVACLAGRSRYPADTDAQAAEAVLHMFSDFRFVIPTVLTARAASKVTDVYMYRFSRVSPVNRTTWGGAGHGTEIPYVFGHVCADESQYEDPTPTIRT
jgi:carboxylesterase type B